MKLSIEVDPDEVGFSAERLTRIDDYFRRYVDDGRLAGWLALVTRNGKVAHLSSCGRRDIEADLPVEADTLWRLYSMTKPVTSIAAMMLYERGVFALDTPISAFIPAFADMRIFAGGTPAQPVTVPAREPIRIWHLLTHTSGLTYGFHRVHPVDAMYRHAGFESGGPKGFDLAASCDAWAALPLVFEPGTEWNYSVSTDVLGRVVEVASGMSLDEFFATEILTPLGMTDTAFWVPGADLPRLAAPYVRGPDGAAARAALNSPDHRPRMLSGGGGLIGTAADYHRLTQFLLRRGELDGVRLLGCRTVDHMTRNQLPGGADLETFGRKLFSEVSYAGTGFGLGFSVLTDPVADRNLGSPGEYAWGGAASTAFWVDPAERITGMFFTQLLPSSTYPVRARLRQLVYQALVD